MKKRILLMLFLFLFVFSSNTFAAEQTSIRDYLMQILEALNSNFNKATIVDAIHGYCGSANNGTFFSMPTTGLCSVGTFVLCNLDNPSNCTNSQLNSLIQNNSKWYWTCNGSGGGTSVECSANKTNTSSSIKVLSPNGGETFYWGETYNITWESSGIEKVNISLQFEDSGGIGLALNVPASSGMFSWTVDTKASTKHKIIISDASNGNVVDKSDNYFDIIKQSGLVNGVCGPLHGTNSSIVQRTEKEFCSSGTPSEIAPNGSWTCYGDNGVNVNCSTKEQTGCSLEKVSNCTNEELVNLLKKMIPVNGSCGSAHNIKVSVAPTSNLCLTGTPSMVSGAGPWHWTCNGQNGGKTVNCLAKKLNDFSFDKPLDQMNKQELINILIMILQVLQNR